MALSQLVSSCQNNTELYRNSLLQLQHHCQKIDPCRNWNYSDPLPELIKVIGYQMLTEPNYQANVEITDMLFLGEEELLFRAAMQGQSSLVQQLLNPSQLRQLNLIALGAAVGNKRWKFSDLLSQADPYTDLPCEPDPITGLMMVSDNIAEDVLDWLGSESYLPIINYMLFCFSSHGRCYCVEMDIISNGARRTSQLPLIEWLENDPIWFRPHIPVLRPDKVNDPFVLFQLQELEDGSSQSNEQPQDLDMLTLEDLQSMFATCLNSYFFGIILSRIGSRLSWTTGKAIIETYSISPQHLATYTLQMKQRGLLAVVVDYLHFTGRSSRDYMTRLAEQWLWTDPDWTDFPFGRQLDLNRFLSALLNLSQERSVRTILPHIKKISPHLQRIIRSSYD